MKFVRYAFIAVLLYCLITTIYGYIIILASRHDDFARQSALNPSAYSKFLLSYFSLAAQWVLLMSCLLLGWIFPYKKKLVFVASILSLLILGALIYESRSVFGYTINQSASSIMAGHERSFVAWIVFYLIAALWLLTFTLKKSPKVKNSDAVALSTSL